jgi:photosystem II stability/assembly factor-like uncharacterized protein
MQRTLHAFAGAAVALAAAGSGCGSGRVRASVIRGHVEAASARVEPAQGPAGAATYRHSLPQPFEVSFSTLNDGIGIGVSGWTGSAGAIVDTGDGGRSWRVRSKIGVIALARASAAVVYAVGSSPGSGGETLLRSGDDGRSWIHAHTPQASRFFSVSFTSPLDGALADDGGRFYATHDGGLTWTLVRAGGEDLRGFGFLTTKHGFAISLSSPSALEETADGGRSWHAYRRAPVERPLGLTALGPGNVWILDGGVYGGGAIVRTVNGGRSWQRIELDEDLSGPLDFVTPSVGYAPGYRTMDGGRDWRPTT